MREDEILRKLLEIYGVEIEALIVAEECGELIKEVSKAVRYGITHTGTLPESYRLSIAEEIADVQIKLRQMMIAYGISDEEVGEEKRRKLLTLERMLKCQKNST